MRVPAILGCALIALACGTPPLATAPVPTSATTPSQAAIDCDLGPEGAAEEATVTRIVDGDTIHVDIDGQEFRVRYIGLDAPEVERDNNPGEPFGNEATEFNRDFVEDQLVVLERDVSDTDQFGRLLRYVWLPSDGECSLEMVNVLLAAQGMADVKRYPPDTRWQDVLQEAENAARDADLGIWAN